MGFMQRQIVLGNWYVVETNDGSEVIEADLVGNDPSADDFTIYLSPNAKVEEFELKENKYGARLSAPGYMDKTDWTLHDTAEEAKKYLEENYPEEEDEDAAEAD